METDTALIRCGLAVCDVHLQFAEDAGCGGILVEV